MTGPSAAFEVQLYRKERWETESLHADQAGAEAAAKSLHATGGRIEGVRVVHEVFDAATNRFNTRIISRWLRGEVEQREAARQTTEADQRVETVLRNTRAARLAADRDRQQRRAAVRPRLPFWFWPFLGALFAALVGVAGLIGLHTLLYPS